MDEKLIHDGVINILNSTNLNSFIQAVIDGGDQRYGRLLWNLIALFSFLPYEIWGITAVIFIERMVGATALAIAFFLLTQLYVKTTMYQVALLIGLFTLPFTVYYATTPKPEPLMLLFLSLFLHRSFGTKNLYGSQWLFLGMVVGLKLSGFFILIAICIFCFLDSVRKRIVPDKSKLLITLAYFMIGISISIPSMFIMAIFGLGLLLLSKSDLSKFIRASSFILLFSVLILTVRISMTSARNYLTWTVGGTSHGSDSDSIDIVSWGAYIFKTYTNSSSVNLLLYLIMLTWGLRRLFVKRKFEAIEPILIGLLLFMLTVLPILLFVHRLWGFYLWIGFVFLVCVFARIIELSSFSTIKLFSGLLIWVLFMTHQGNYPVSSFRLETSNISNVENSPEFKIQQIRYRKIVEILRNTSVESDLVLRVAYDPLLWVPASTSEVSISLFWGPFTNWQENYDLIVLSSVHTSKEIGPANRDTPQRLLEIQGLKENLIGFNEDCKRDFCYFLYKEFDGVSVLKRM